MRDLAVVKLGDEKPIGWAGLILTVTVDVRDHAVACFDEGADRDLAAGEPTDPHAFERLLAATAPGDPAVLVGEALPVQVVVARRAASVIAGQLLCCKAGMTVCTRPVTTS